MKALKFFTFLYILTTFTLYSQGVVWKAESDTISAKTFDSLMKINMYYSFITDDNQFVLAGSVTTGNILNHILLIITHLLGYLIHLQERWLKQSSLAIHTNI